MWPSRGAARTLRRERRRARSCAQRVSGGTKLDRHPRLQRGPAADAAHGARAAIPDSGHLTPFRVGCSGWQYRHWRGDFYPADLPQSRWLEFYASRFDTVEVNNSFYRLPPEDLFSTWRGRVPARFLFAVKASRYLTHMKKLRDPIDPLAKL